MSNETALQLVLTGLPSNVLCSEDSVAELGKDVIGPYWHDLHLDKLPKDLLSRFDFIYLARGQMSSKESQRDINDDITLFAFYGGQRESLVLETTKFMAGMRRGDNQRLDVIVGRTFLDPNSEIARRDTLPRVAHALDMLGKAHSYKIFYPTVAELGTYAPSMVDMKKVA